MSRSNIEYLKHALDEIDFLEKQTQNLAEDGFMQDELMQHAFIRSLEIIGEAVKQIPEEIRNKYKNIDWKAYAGFRDKLIHHYFGVDYALVWDVIINELPELKKKLFFVLEQEKAI